ncbi:MAG: hypothetical protein H0T43_07795 [Solirubrobacterales bacterium]|nr:hypothetical protein [Solirubrobacterales bacterium]
MRTRTMVIAALAATALVAAGCGDDDEDEGGGGAAAKPATLKLTATAAGANRKTIDAPASVPPGLVTITLRNTDKVAREAQLVRIEGDQSPQDVLKAVSTENGPLPQFIQDGGGVAPVKPGQTGTVTQVLAPGRYVIFDTGSGEEGENVRSNAEMGALKELTVVGQDAEGSENAEAADAELPKVPGRITAVDYGFTTAGLKAGKNQVRFENTGKELHHAILFPLNKGATIEDATKAFSQDGPPKGPPPIDFRNASGTAVIDGDYAQNVELDLKAGSYAAVCFIQDRKGGPPHVAKGMIAEVTVR